MNNGILKSIMAVYRRIATSIAFVPAVIGIAMLAISVVMIEFDFSDGGKDLKANLHWLSLKDANTARIICSTIAAGIFSLTVFSFSMVMILLSQAAAQMSNRILGKLIQNRFQQVVLGFYIGTILYALFLLSTIRDIDNGVHVPAISTYVLIAFTILDIFLFIYFLHYVTQSVKFDTVIYRIFKDTQEGLEAACNKTVDHQIAPAMLEGSLVPAFRSGSFEGFNKRLLLGLCEKYDICVSFVYPVRTYMLCEATTLLVIKGAKAVPENVRKELYSVIDIGRSHDVTTSYYYGLKQLMEIAIKALSPGINDPGTCILSLQALSELLAFRLLHSPQTIFRDADGTIRICTTEKTFDEIFNEHILPIWDYGKNDRLVQRELSHILHQLQAIRRSTAVDNLLKKCMEQIAKQDY